MWPFAAGTFSRGAIAPGVRTQGGRQSHVTRKRACDLRRQAGRGRLPAEAPQYAFAVNDDPRQASGYPIVIGVFRIGIPKNFAVRDACEQPDASERRGTA